MLTLSGRSRLFYWMWLAVMYSLHRMPGVSKPNYPIQPFFEVSSSGRTAGFDPAYRGSNPCTSAIYTIMQLTKCFSVPFWQTQLNFDAATVAAKCMQMRDSGFDNRTVSNRGGWQSTNFNLNNYSEFKQLVIEINNSLRLIGHSINNNLRLNPGSAWININEKGNQNVSHNHSSYSSTLSSVIYIQVDENTGRIYFEDNFSPMVYYPHMLPAKRKLFLTKEYFIPTTGMMLTFPAWIPHGVEPSRSDLTRISIAFNISVGER